MYAWRGKASDAELVELIRSHGGRAVVGWWDRIRPHSLGWVTVRDASGLLVGFANVAWDGSDPAFLLDTKTRGTHQRQGIATRVVEPDANGSTSTGTKASRRSMWTRADSSRPRPGSSTSPRAR